MSTPPRPRRFELFLTCPPGLEPQLLGEIQDLGWTGARALEGGVRFGGAWHDVWRANLLMRGANRVLVRLGSFRAPSLNVLHGRVRELPFGDVLRANQPFHVDATCRKSKIYHSGAAEERVANAVAAATGAEGSDGEGLKIIVRIARDEATISVDTSGALLHKRGFKQEVAGAPLRETTASLLLRACGHAAGEPLVDPMCGSGTVPLEAADIAASLAPGRARSFAFEAFPSFLADAYARSRAKALAVPAQAPRGEPAIIAADRSSGAVEAARANAERAGTAQTIAFRTTEISRLEGPEGPPGLVFCNPPYGARLGDGQELGALYRAFGQVMRERFSGWRVGLVTTDPKLAAATGLPFGQPGPFVPHGALKIRLWQTGPL